MIVTAVLLSGIVSMVSCDKSDGQTVEDGQIIISGKTSVEFTHAPQTITITVLANMDYESAILFEKNASPWITQAQNIAAGSMVFNIAENKEPDDRFATIKFVTADQKASAAVKVKQCGLYVYKFTHTGYEFRIPTFVGNDMVGTIDWGNGEMQKYNESIVYHYDTREEHCVSVTIDNAESFRLENIKGVSLIEL